MSDYHDMYIAHRAKLAAFLLKHQLLGLAKHLARDEEKATEIADEIQIITMAVKNCFDVRLTEIHERVEERSWTPVRFKVGMPSALGVVGIVHLSDSAVAELNDIYMDYFKAIPIHDGSNMTTVIPDIRALKKLQVCDAEANFTKQDGIDQSYYFG